MGRIEQDRSSRPNNRGRMLVDPKRPYKDHKHLMVVRISSSSSGLVDQRRMAYREEERLHNLSPIPKVEDMVVVLATRDQTHQQEEKQGLTKVVLS